MGSKESYSSYQHGVLVGLYTYLSVGKMKSLGLRLWGGGRGGNVLED